MILVDAAIWIDQLHHPDDDFASLLQRQIVVMHPYVAGEILLGSLRDRRAIRMRLIDLDRAPVARHEEVTNLIESVPLFGTGVGYVDAHLIASTMLMVGGRIWTRDRRLARVASQLRINFD